MVCVNVSMYVYSVVCVGNLSIYVYNMVYVCMCKYMYTIYYVYLSIYVYSMYVCLFLFKILAHNSLNLQ